MHTTQRPAKDGHEGPKPGGRPAGPTSLCLGLCPSFLGYDSVHFLSLPTFLATSKLGRVEFRPSFFRRSGALLVGSFIRCSS
jgi:hypothetical protein